MSIVAIFCRLEKLIQSGLERCAPMSSEGYMRCIVAANTGQHSLSSIQALMCATASISFDGTGSLLRPSGVSAKTEERQ